MGCIAAGGGFGTSGWWTGGQEGWSRHGKGGGMGPGWCGGGRIGKGGRMGLGIGSGLRRLVGAGPDRGCRRVGMAKGGGFGTEIAVERLEECRERMGVRQAFGIKGTQ